jgi:hypothetical protein
VGNASGIRRRILAKDVLGARVWRFASKPSRIGRSKAMVLSL